MLTGAAAGNIVTIKRLSVINGRTLKGTSFGDVRMLFDLLIFSNVLFKRHGSNGLNGPKVTQSVFSTEHHDAPVRCIEYSYATC